MSNHCTYQSKPAAVIRITGDDAPTYLQSQFSNDLAPSEPGKVTYGLWLDRKGKVQADSFVFHLAEEDYLLLSYDCAADALIAKLEENIIADEVEMENLTPTATLFSEINLPECDSPPADGFSPINKGEPDGLVFRGRRSARPTREMLCLSEAPTVNTNGIPVDVAWMAYERISANIPAVPTDIGPADLPQEGGLESVAVSFTKGCYLGQEVMARLHAMGKVQRALHQITLEQMPAAVMPCDVLDTSGKTVGQVRSVAQRDGQLIGVAMLKKRAVAADQLLKLADSSPITVKDACA